jgi:hypothetical protein
VSRHDESGLSLIEVIVASVVLLVGLLATTSVFRSSFTAAGTTSDRNTATTLANNIVAAAVAYGCGLETGVDLPPGVPANPAEPGAPTAANVDQRCASIYGPQATVLGDPPLRPDTLSGVTYDIGYRTAWNAPGVSGCPAGFVDPVGATQSVSISWTAAGVQEHVAATNFVATPGGTLYTNSALGALTVSGMAATGLVTVAVPGWSTIERFAASGTCAWFPFLPAAGGYTVSYYASGSPSGTPTSTETAAVAAGALTRVAV